ncbi:RNA-binding protein NOB1, putative [Plasmodium relictum]|uniref:RNA-binding protein NOB1, putative n=1 Tax=Plasmodium relictum TaxID=85471 RepID=A0A1J1H2J2_PLARL|nr:RNA-binding protein NOB1, putative [Plasmodium relictum]CRG98982.1 RNA-binding protein NOB1, putative [Plasmodium relictum]
MEKKKYVLDANSLIKFKDFLFMNYDCYITEGVIKEIKDENSKKKLNNILPLLKVDKAEEKDINFIKYFSKLTGDYDSLSEVDIEVIALTYMLHRKYGDVSKLRSSPLETIYKYDDVTYDYSNYSDKKKYNKKNRKNKNVIEEISSINDSENLEKEEIYDMKNNMENEDEFKREDYAMEVEKINKTDKSEENEVVDESEDNKNEAVNESEDNKNEVVDESEDNKNEVVNESEDNKNEVVDESEDNKNEVDESEDNKNEVDESEDNKNEVDDESENNKSELDDQIHILKKGNKKIFGCETIKEEVIEVIANDNDDKDGKWININNFDTYNLNIDKKEQFDANIACITTDYSMQNVLYQIGLNVITIDGYKINSIKLWGYFCTSCYFFMRRNSILFCSKCGNNNLRKVNVIVDNNLKKLVVKIPQFRINNKNTIFSIPKKKKNSKFEEKLHIFREDELLIGGRKQYIAHQKKLYENQRNIKNPFNGDNIYDYNDWAFRTTLKSGKVAVLKNPKIIVGGKRNSHKKKR